MSQTDTLPLVVGALHYDIVVQTTELPRLDETAVGTRWFPKFGGKGGNQAVAAFPSRMVGAVGADDFGRFLSGHLHDVGVDSRFVTTLSDAASGMSVAVMNAAGDYAATIVSGSNLKIDAAVLDQADVWENVGILVLQNEIPEAINYAAARIARRRGVPVLLNAAPARDLSPEFQELIDVLVVNAVEAEMFGTEPVEDLASARGAAEVLGKKFPAVVVTAGSHGLAWVSGGGTAIALPAEKVKVVSSHGAGDCFTGALARALAEGADLAMACRTASVAAAAHVSCVKA
ncbi:PfkB family carbohydrate kinase [Pseudoprimorskyibacter insulae]|uniref:Ribokinase n=1 Tax=Pseudoprimorskyibacter insulae TaxID=1695997 RepID=A0A2R8AZP2_9RHOB|nr:PfkB family carbohydrate kinase [Pseudoprimorskyibacter insulae]SPF81498.1 Ribokinase [Pseudoprimorskyibacter insulae]